jgi:hypothetical protein
MKQASVSHPHHLLFISNISLKRFQTTPALSAFAERKGDGPTSQRSPGTIVGPV